MKLTRLPERTLVLSVTARARGGRSATAERTYQSCQNRRPVITVPSGAPPATLTLRDITVGGGREAKSGRDVSVQYAGVAWSNGKEFDATWDRGGEPFEFPLGAEMVIPGFEQGISGMRVGGRREIVIPPNLGYGEEGSGPIRPNETLIFVIDLVSVRYP